MKKFFKIVGIAIFALLTVFNTLMVLGLCLESEEGRRRAARTHNRVNEIETSLFGQNYEGRWDDLREGRWDDLRANDRPQLFVTKDDFEPTVWRAIIEEREQLLNPWPKWTQGTEKQPSPARADAAVEYFVGKVFGVPEIETGSELPLPEVGGVGDN